ncbi:MAG TPA: glycosyltransferase family 4 protein [Candidatus Acidoferrales bacterium]|nr:glycosyltransferase family 4 protein [Candidatus Acidoferrales bacterium]
MIKDRVPWWGQRTELLPGWREYVDKTWRKRERSSVFDDLRWGWRFYRASKHYDAVVSGYERPAVLFALLQRFCRRQRVPHVFLYVSFNLPESRLAKTLRRLLIRQIIAVACRIVVHSKHQGREYARVFRSQLSKFSFVPYFSTTFGASYPTSEGGYVFAGGDYTRDYANLIEAVGPLPYRVVIAAFFRHYFKGIQIPPNVEILTTTPDGFNELIAGANVIVVPLQGGLLHPGGHNTFLSAMALGKTVIVTDDGGAEDYIKDGETGVLIRPGAPEELRRSIRTLMENRELARSIGEKASVAARGFSLDSFLIRVLELARECANGKKPVS